MSIRYYNLSGSINDEDGKPNPGITVNLESESNQYSPAVTGLGGTWSSSRLEGKVVVRPVSDEYSFEPESYQIVGGSNNLDFAAETKIFAGGTGSEYLPYKIATAEQLNQVRNYLDKHFVLLNDLDLVSFSDGEGWEPIGSYSDPFEGYFDGQGYMIANLTINRPEQNYVGLFGVLHGAVVENLNLAGADISGNHRVGSLAGSALSAVIEQCTIEGEVRGRDYVGGLVGHVDFCSVISCSGSGDVRGSKQVGGLVGSSQYGTLIQCHAEGVVKADNGWAGGIAGTETDGHIQYCYAIVDVEAEEAVGGLVGGATNTDIDSCYATGQVTGKKSPDSAAGGLVGHSAYNSTITNCFATGQVNGFGQRGGLVGLNADNAKVSNCYAIGEVTEPYGETTGGLVGVAVNSDNVTNSLYDQETTGQSDSGKGEPKSTDAMWQKATYTAKGWDFNSVWDIDQYYAYPFLIDVDNPY